MMALMTDPFEKSVAVDAKVKPPEDVVNISKKYIVFVFQCITVFRYGKIAIIDARYSIVCSMV